jgi:4-diphosphocytidyl-2C-methyl-D-erythritol kinase
MNKKITICAILLTIILIIPQALAAEFKNAENKQIQQNNSISTEPLFQFAQKFSREYSSNNLAIQAQLKKEQIKIQKQSTNNLQSGFSRQENQKKNYFSALNLISIVILLLGSSGFFIFRFLQHEKNLNICLRKINRLQTVNGKRQVF